MSIRVQLQRNYTARIDNPVITQARRTVLHWLDLDVPVAPGRARAGHVRLKNSRRVRDRTNPSSRSITITYPTPVANYTDEGTHAHTIRARRKKALRFKIDGKTVYARQVRWRPGPGVKRNKRWFRKNTSQTAWRIALRQAMR